MRQIRLNKLSLRDFKGMTFTLDADGDNVDVFGANATGKTTIADAFSWLLFGKDSLGRADFEIKNIDANGEHLHNLEHSVEGILRRDDHTVTLKRVLTENWTKKRGSATSTFSGHNTQYYVDGVPKSEKDYRAYIAELAGDEMIFRLLTSPTVFPNLPAEKGIPGWKRQRTLLFDVCGDMSDINVIAADASLAKLPGIIGSHKIEDYRKIITARRAEVNKEIEKIPIRIDEVKRSQPDIVGLNRKALEAEVQSLETAVNDAKLRLQGINTGGNIAVLTAKRDGLTADLRKFEDSHRSGSLAALNRLNQQISEATMKITEARRRLTTLHGELTWKEGDLTNVEGGLTQLREQWMGIDAEIFKDAIADTCAACGQSLPAERVKEAGEKALAAFNQHKASLLTDIDIKGKSLAGQRDQLKTAISALKEEIQGLEIRLPDTETELKRLTDERNALKNASEDFSGIPGRTDMLRQIAEIEAQITTEREGRTQDAKTNEADIQILGEALQSAKEQVAKFVNREKSDQRIADLMAEEKKLTTEFERLESELYLTEQFVRTKVQLLTERINSRFEIARFKLFETQINGGISEVCEITVNGIPYNGGLNNAARINAGLDVCRTLSEHYGLRVPIFVDNAESVCHLINMPSQIIRLVVSEQDSTLRVEMARQEVAA